MLVAAFAAQDTLLADCRSDFKYGGGAGETADPVHSIRSGNPSQLSSAAIAQPLLPGTTVQRVAFDYQYNTGYGHGGDNITSTNFTAYVGGVAVYSSPPLVDYAYEDNRSLYSPPVHVDAAVQIAVPANASNPRFEIHFANNDRNVQLMLPLRVNLTCAGDACVSPPLWEPPKRTVVFSDGEADEGGKPIACFRIPGLAHVPAPSVPVTTDRFSGLVAFAESRRAGCRPDVDIATGIVARRSLDGMVGEHWSPIHVVQDRAETGKGLNYPSPIVDERSGRIHLFYSEFGVGTWYTTSDDGGATWAPKRNDTGVALVGGGGGVQLADGRLVIQCAGNASVAACFSDDGGATWRRGADCLAAGATC